MNLKGQSIIEEIEDNKVRKEEKISTLSSPPIISLVLNKLNSVKAKYLIEKVERLENIFPLKLKRLIDPRHRHHINLFKLNRPYLKINISSSIINPNELHEPYCNFSYLEGDLEFVKDSSVSKDSDTKVFILSINNQKKICDEESFSCN